MKPAGLRAVQCARANFLDQQWHHLFNQ